MRILRTFALAFLLLPVGGAGAYAAEIPYKPHVSLTVGKTAVLKGVRGQCGKAPPSWAQIKGSLPATTLGTFSDGGVGTVRSSRCGGITPARAVRFTATKAGRQNFTIFDDAFAVTVK